MITHKQYKRCLSLGFPPLPTVEQQFSNIVAKPIVNDIIFAQLQEMYRKRDWLRYNAIASDYFPDVLQQYINKKYFIIDINNKKIKIPIVYSKASGTTAPFASCDYYYDYKGNIVIEQISFTSKILVCEDRMIDCIIAHELAHAKRYLENRAKDDIEHEEYWADREIKKMLPIVNSKYNNRSERRKSLMFLHSRINRVSQTGIFTPLGEFWDRLFPFHNIPQ